MDFRKLTPLYLTTLHASSRRLTLSLVYGLLLLCWLMPGQAQAQDTEADTTAAAQEEQAPNWPEDSLGRRTPRGAVYGFIKSVAAQDYDRAALYLKLDTTLQQNRDGATMARSLQRLLDQSGQILPYAWLSDNPEGRDDDDLGPNLDRVGEAELEGSSFDLFVEKTEGEGGAPVWLFSSQTVQRIPVPLDDAATTPLVDKVSPDIIEENSWGGVPISHWLAIVLVAIVSYLVARAIVALILLAIPFVWTKARDEDTAGIIGAFGLPVRLYLAVWLFVFASEAVGISIIVRLRLSEITLVVGLVAFLILLWRLIDFVSNLIQRRLARHNNQAGISAILFLRRGVKIGIVVLGIIMALDTFGFDVTTGLAALGIGGIALALGAQKTVENFVGSVMLIADQPVRVGDFCKVGSITGTVEQIGMRSTRLRTGERTVVTIPNGEFSSQSIENFAHRDRFLFQTTLGVRYETTPDQLRYLLVELRTILYAHPKVSETTARVRFIELGKDSLNLEIFTYILAKSFDEFLEVKEDLLLRIMDTVADSGTDFAFTSQTLYLSRDKGVSEEKAQEVQEKVRQWKEAGELQLPSFDEARIRELRGSIPYPPEGSVQHSPAK
ncbi:mechanosensitive ion channel family protein [Pontibacter roseus]|uniref:mechanosensitive ion channel family protein n=1 Tax=Pontibacter roseus TaxID=336989 RepID=UPI000399F3CD|nr:mechanosensitive ion channel family protein [Pontibacter roseus]